MKLLRLRYYLLILLIGIVALILGGIFDKQVSDALYASGSLENFGLVISNYLLVPFFIASSATALLAALILIKDGKGYHPVFRIIFAVIFVGAFFFLKYQEYDKIIDISDACGKTLGLILTIITMVITLCISILIALRLYKKYDHKEALKLAICYAAILGLSMIFAVAFKYLWSRPRPWYVFGRGELPSHLAEFRNIWEPTPFAAFSGSAKKEYFKSFPSNHVNSVNMFPLALLFYTKLNKKLDNEWSRTWITFMALALAIITGLTRILCGAHFLGDVSFGMIMTFSVTYFGFLAIDILNKKYEFLKFENNEIKGEE